MRSLNSIVLAASFALVGACGTDHGNTGQQEGNSNDTGSQDNGQGGEGSGSGGSAAACPLGAATFASELGVSFSDQQLSLAVDANGNALLAGSFDAINFPSATAFTGFAEIMANGQAGLTLPMGSLVATDAAGDIFIAGAFSSAIDFGNGLVLQPQGNVDTFIAELDAKGHVIFAKALDLCGGNGIAAMVVGKDGRIAISGSAMGTVVLAANGDVLFTVPDFGKVAFDAQGNLVIAGSADIRDASVPTFLAMYDANGMVVARTVFDGSAQLTGLAVDANGTVYLAGFTTGSINLFGTVIQANFANEPGRISGAFLVKLANGCASALQVTDLGIVEVNGIAIDANGQIFLAGAVVGDTGFGRYLDLVKIDVRGIMSSVDLGLGAFETVNGRVVAVAADACGSIYAALVKQDTPSAGSTIHALLIKVSL